MFAKWQSSVLLAPSSMVEFCLALPRTASKKFIMWRVVISPPPPSAVPASDPFDLTVFDHFAVAVEQLIAIPVDVNGAVAAVYDCASVAAIGFMPISALAVPLDDFIARKPERSIHRIVHRPAIFRKMTAWPLPPSRIRETRPAAPSAQHPVHGSRCCPLQQYRMSSHTSASCNPRYRAYRPYAGAGP